MRKIWFICVVLLFISVTVNGWGDFPRERVLSLDWWHSPALETLKGQERDPIEIDAYLRALATEENLCVLTEKASHGDCQSAELLIAMAKNGLPPSKSVPVRRLLEKTFLQDIESAYRNKTWELYKEHPVLLWFCAVSIKAKPMDFLPSVRKDGVDHLLRYSLENGCEISFYELIHHYLHYNKKKELNDLIGEVRAGRNLKRNLYLDKCSIEGRYLFENGDRVDWQIESDRFLEDLKAGMLQRIPTALFLGLPYAEEKEKAFKVLIDLAERGYRETFIPVALDAFERERFEDAAYYIYLTLRIATNLNPIFDNPLKFYVRALWGAKNYNEICLLYESMNARAKKILWPETEIGQRWKSGFDEYISWMTPYYNESKLQTKERSEERVRKVQEMSRGDYYESEDFERRYTNALRSVNDDFDENETCKK